LNCSRYYPNGGDYASGDAIFLLSC